MTNQPEILSARKAIRQEILGLEALSTALDDKFVKAVNMIVNLKGRVILSGMGKSGHIARKIASSFSSTGTPSLFVHPAEASHGDLGMITQEDLLILLSNSGETIELRDIINYAKRFSIPLIAMVRRKTSALVSASDIAFILPEIAEASPIEAPTTSTTMMLAWGDALVVAVLEKKGFSNEKFGELHPGGKIGSQFIMVEQLMRKGNELPIVQRQDKMSEVLIIMTKKATGSVIVIDNDMKVVGIITDGDLRRHMDHDITKRSAEEIMKKDPISINQDSLASQALGIMNEKSITSLVVTENNKLKGLLHIHDILKAGVS